MRPIYKIPSTTTVNALVAELYDVVDPRTGSMDVGRRNGAAQALRDLNPSLPADESSVNPASIPWIRLRFIPRTPWRLPPEPSGLRTDLATMGVRNVESMVGTTARYLQAQVTGLHTLTEVTRLHNLARLMRVSGMDRATAVYFHDHPTTPLKTPEDLSGASATTVKSMVEAHIAAGFPAVLADETPWNLWRSHAKQMTRKGSAASFRASPVPFKGATALAQSKVWATEAASATRTATERASAETLTWLYALQAEYLEGNEALLRRDGGRALQRYRRVWSILGEKALDLGLVASNSDEVDGPSIETVIKVCGRLLDTLQSGDEETARDAFGAEAPRSRTDGMQSFAVGDLLSGNESTVGTALRSHPTSVLGRKGLKSLDRSFSERITSSLGTGLALGVATPNTSGRALDFGTADAQQLAQNARSLTISDVQDNEGTAWAEAKKVFRLRDVRGAVGTALDTGGTTPAASAALKSSVTALYPSNLLNNMSPFDRFIAFTPSGKPGAAQRFVPVNAANFATRYRVDFLKALAAEGDVRVHNFAAVDFADPSRFLMILPQIFARHLPVAMGRSLTLTGNGALGTAIVRSAPVGTSVFDSGLTRSLRDWIGYGQGLVSTLQHDCSDYLGTDGVSILYAFLQSLNEQGDAAYQQGSYGAAQSYYEQVINTANQCADVAGSLALTFPDIYDDIVTRVDQGDLTVGPYAINEYVIVDPAVTSIWEDLLGGVIIWETEERLATDRMTEMVANYARSANLNVFRHYGAGTRKGSPSLQRGEARQDHDATRLELQPTSLGFLGSTLSRSVTRVSATGSAMTVSGVSDASDAISAAVAHAQAYLAQLQAGLNWLGFDPDMTPIWRYTALRDWARYYIGKADEIQQRTFALLNTYEDQALAQLEAELQSQIADAQVAVAEAQYNLAVAQQTAALNSVDAAGAAVSVVKDDTAWDQILVWKGTIFAAIGAAAGSGSAMDVASEGGTALLHVADNEELVNAAEADLAVAEAQYDVSVEQVAVATAQVTAASMTSAAATQTYEALASQLTNAENLLNLVGSVEQISNAYVDMATRIAWLAERAYYWESRRAGSYVRMCYQSSSDFSTRFSGAAQLSADLDAIDHARITSETDRYQLLKTTFSLYAHNPAELYALQQGRRCIFSLTQRQLDERFPGLYQHSLRRIEVEIDGLIPSTGISATLKTANNGLVRVPGTTDFITDTGEVDSDWCYPESSYPILDEHSPAPFVLKPMLSNGFTMVLSEYQVSRDGAVLSAPEGALDAFEHLPMDVIWVLELPTTATPFDPASITDVRFILYFNAQYSGELEGRQNDVWAADIVSRSSAFVASQQAASSLETLINGPSDTRFRDVRLLTFDIDDDDLPRNIKPYSRHPENILFAFTQDGDVPFTVHFRGSMHAEPAEADVPYGDADLPNGLLYSALGSDDIVIDTTTYPKRLGDHPTLDAWVTAAIAAATNVNGRYVLKLLPEDNPDLCLKDDDGDYVDVTSGQLTLGNGGFASWSGGDWKNAQVTVRAKITTGQLELRLRDASGSYVYAKISTGAVSVGDSAGLFPSTARSYVVADEWTEITMRAVGSTVELLIDNVSVCITSSATVTGAGTFTATATTVGASIVLYDVRVTRLSSAGTELEDVVVEPFDASPGSEWPLSGSCAWSATTHRVLDLQSFSDVALVLDFTGRFDVS